jgi:hypothetical protein
MDVDVMTAMNPGEPKSKRFRTGHGFCKADVFGTGYFAKLAGSTPLAMTSEYR